MADITNRRVTYNGKRYEPNTEIRGLSAKTRKRLLERGFIRDDVAPADIEAAQKYAQRIRNAEDAVTKAELEAAEAQEAVKAASTEAATKKAEEKAEKAAKALQTAQEKLAALRD